MEEIGKSYKRIDALEKVLGQTKFLDDLPDENFLHAAPVYSGIPFGQILSIDFSKAKSYPDFVDFISAKDISGENQVGVIIEDQPLFADKIVRFVGDVIGLIVAKSPQNARDIAKLVEIKIEELSPYFTIDESRNATEIFLHDSNLACEHQVIRGDIETGFTDADLIIEETFKTSVAEHYYLEPQGCIAFPKTDKMKLLGSLQCPFYIQKAVSRVLGIPLENVEVEQSPTGGAFGGKEDVPSELCARVAVAAQKLGKPVKMVYSRKEDVQLTSKRHPFQMRYKVGVSKSGKLLAAEILLEENAGAYATLSSVVSYRAAMQAMGPYKIPNVKVRSKSYYTNLPPNGAFRGFGSPQATFGHERIMDILAKKLGIDPVEFRMKNMLEVGDETMTGQKLTSSVGAKETLQNASERINNNIIQNNNNSHYLEGIGIASCHYGNCLGAAGWHLDGAGVNIKIRKNGKISVAFGLVEMGQGAETVVAQMTAQALGVTTEIIEILPTSTIHVPDSGPSVASRNVVMTGNAIRNAAEELLPILKKVSAEILNCDQENIEIKNCFAKNLKSERKITFSEIAGYLHLNGMKTQSNGWWHVPELDYDSETGTGEAYFTYSYATQIAKVRVDRLTGIVKVEKIWAAHDIGKAINPAGLQAQVEGGTAQGIGWALTENFKYEHGKAVTQNLSTYLIPTAQNTAKVETILVEDSEPLGPWGAKGIGEPAIIPTAAAIANAVSNATGIEFNEIPMTPENVLEKIES